MKRKYFSYNPYLVPFKLASYQFVTNNCLFLTNFLNVATLNKLNNSIEALESIKTVH